MADQSYKIGRIFGIDIEIHWTLALLIIIFYVLSVYSNRLDSFILIVLLFVCVLIHEISHSVVALRNKVKVKRIILLPLGGASIIDQLEMDPRVEFNIAVAGPLMSLLLCSIFGLLVTVLPAGALTYIFQLLFLMNLLLGVFNLLPAFPTDGGRVFRSYLEKKYDAYKATMLTVKASNYVMGLFVIGTLFYVILIPGSSSFNQFLFLWNLLIAVFLYEGAQSEKRAMEIKKEAVGVTLKEVISGNFCLVKPGTKLRELYEIVKRTRKHLLITKIGDAYAYVNVLTKAKLSTTTTAGGIAKAIPTIEMSTNIVDALEALAAGEIGIAAVTRRGRLVGIVTSSHLETFLALHVVRAEKKK